VSRTGDMGKGMCEMGQRTPVLRYMNTFMSSFMHDAINVSMYFNAMLHELMAKRTGAFIAKPCSNLK